MPGYHLQHIGASLSEYRRYVALRQNKSGHNDIFANFMSVSPRNQR